MNPPDNAPETPPPAPIFPLQPQPPILSPPKKQFKWRALLITLGILQLAAIGGIIALWMIALAMPFVGIFLLLMVFAYAPYIIGALSLANLIALILYLVNRKPEGKKLALPVISLIVSIGLLSLSSYAFYQMHVVLPQQMNKMQQETSERIKAQDQAYAMMNAQPEITKEEAISLLKACKLKGFYYTQETKEEHNTTPASSKTGIVLTKVRDEPYRINIADRLIPELVPIARDAQKSCKNPQFWHDGSYEQYKDGKWYFKNEVVNTVQTGNTKEEAVTFMQSCKADYFIGYTDISLIKDANTKAWLEKAEASSTGLAISDTGPKAYVFASKAMNTELQNIARQSRESCYSIKKLYITEDDWIETEYPAGKWTRLKQQ